MRGVYSRECLFGVIRCISFFFKSFLGDIEITTEDENNLLATSDEEEVGTPLNIDELFVKCERTFRYDEVNTREYHREVRRIIHAKMDAKRPLSGAYYHSFCRRFERERGVDSKSAKPDYDAWCLIIGKSRTCFDTKKFFRLYENTREQIVYIRNLINIKVSENF